MEKDKKNASPNINAELMMNLMEEGVKKEGLIVPETPAVPFIQKADTGAKDISPDKMEMKEKGRSKRNMESNYEHIFFRKTDTNARDGKTVYIRPEFHDKLSRIVQVIGEDKITIYAYLDNLLDFHFREFGEQITKSYNDKYKPIL